MEVAIHTEQPKEKKKAASWPGAMKCTISPGSVALGFLKGKKVDQCVTLCLV